MFNQLSAILPDTAQVSKEGHLIIGGCDVVGLAEEFGTPLYIFDEATLRHCCAEYREEFGDRYPNTLVIYACKAFINPALAQLFKEEGLGLDVVSGGELAIAKSMDFPLERVYFHGNNKTQQELELALEWGIGRIVVDNLYELSLLNEIAEKRDISQDILLRLSPGIDPHTHRYLTTGVIDSKFGFPIASGQAEEAIKQSISASNLNPIGLHVHLGSLIYKLEPYQKAVEVMLRFAAEMKGKHNFELLEFSPGGGFAIPHTSDAPAPATADFAQAITSALLSVTKELSLTPPKLIVEPGRAIVGRAGVAVYRVGAIKEIPGIRKYISIDGGIGDNIRPALYGSRYEAMVANKAMSKEAEMVTIAGRFCQSGDILIKDIELPHPVPGDIVAVPVCGAYSIPMSSNYNAALKPAIVMVKEGKAHLIRRRETYEDLVSRDIL
jgi:diaminopimelate decarboxylase